MVALLLVAGAPAGAQGVRLELRPRVGDTLRLRMEQSVEVIATSHVQGRDSTVTMRRTVTLFSRSVIEQVDASGARVLAMADSMLMTDGSARQMRQLGARVTMHVAPDGTTRILDAGGAMTPETAALISQTPAMLPARPVPIGGSWTHSTVMPIPGQPEEAGAGTLAATFHLDSLSHYGDLAFVTMHGTLSRPDGGVMLPRGVRYESSGTLSGTLRVDRRRGWLTDLRATILVRSVLTAQGAPPVNVRTRVTQTVHAEP